MIGKFWDMLFDYADRAKASGDKQRYEIVHEIEDLLQTAYDLGVASSSVIVDYRGRGDMERLILSIPDIKVYKDTMDGDIWYELDCCSEPKRFDTPQEVIKYLIAYRTRGLTGNMGKERSMIIEEMIKRLEQIQYQDVFKYPRKIVEVEVEKND